MARKARVEFEGAVYHVLDRGDRREAIFRVGKGVAARISLLAKGVRVGREDKGTGQLSSGQLSSWRVTG